MRVGLPISLLAACSLFPEQADTELLQPVELASPSEHVCIPPSEGTADIYVTGDDLVTIEGVLREVLEGTDPEPGLTAGEGVEVEAWALANGTLLPERSLAATETDANGGFTVSFDPAGVEDLGIRIDGRHDHILRWFFRATSAGSGDLLCAYWADPDTGRQISSADGGSEVELVVEARAPYEDPSINIAEVGNDLGGTDVVASFTGGAFVDGVSRSRWTADGAWAPLEGGGLEFAFTVIATQPATNTEDNVGSEWLRVAF